MVTELSTSSRECSPPLLFMSVGELNCYHTLWVRTENREMIGDYDTIVAREQYLYNLSTDWDTAVAKAQKVSTTTGMRLLASDNIELDQIRAARTAEQRAIRSVELEAAENEKMSKRFEDWLTFIEAGQMPWGKFRGYTFDHVLWNDRGYAEYIATREQGAEEGVHWTLVSMSSIIKQRLHDMIMATGGYLPKITAGHLAPELLGTRIPFTATIIRENGYDGGFGWVFIFTLVTPEGNCLLYKGSAVLGEGNVGDVITGKATVKCFDDYNGIPQTVIQRVKVDSVTLWGAA